MTDIETDHQPSVGPLTETSPGRRPVVVLAVSLAVVFALMAAALGLLLVSSDDGDGRLEEVRSAAGRFGAALVTYDFQAPDEHRDEVLSLATGSFAGEYEDAFDQGLRQLITQAEATSEGFVKDIYVSEIDDEQAQAIVVVDIQHDGSGGPRTLYDVYFRLTFVQVDGSWKVDDVTDLRFDAGGALGAGGIDSAPSTAQPDSTTTSLP